ncbi:MAG: hypothetical protein OXJ54_11025 [Gemmatimonadetes bacterium]|nr:hypothetical protein [Candidatus Palauibacter rhopaloidicola]
MLSYTRIAAAVAAVGVAVMLPGCSDAPEPATRQNPSTPAPSAAPREVVVAATMTTADLVSERVCLDQGGPHVLEAEAASENMATGFLTIDDGSEDGEYVTSAMRLAGQARQIRSEQVELHAGEPCYLVSAQTGITGERATTRLIRLDTLPETRQESQSSMDSDEPTEFSAHTTQLLTLYEELHSFKDDPNFHDVGFGTCCRFHDWQTRAEALQSSAGLETLADVGVLPGDLLTLGMEYMRSKGRPTEYTNTMEPHYALGLAALAH